MAWTASIYDVTREGSQVEVVVQLVDDATGERVRKRYVAEPTVGFNEQLWLKRQILTFLTNVAPAQTVRSALVRGAAVDLTPETPIVPVDPDPARTAFLNDWHRFESWKRAVDAGVAPVTQAFTDARVALAAAWLPRYVGLV